MLQEHQQPPPDVAGSQEEVRPEEGPFPAESFDLKTVTWEPAHDREYDTIVDAHVGMHPVAGKGKNVAEKKLTQYGLMLGVTQTRFGRTGVYFKGIENTDAEVRYTSDDGEVYWLGPRDETGVINPAVQRQIDAAQKQGGKNEPPETWTGDHTYIDYLRVNPAGKPTYLEVETDYRGHPDAWEVKATVREVKPVELHIS